MKRTKLFAWLCLIVLVFAYHLIVRIRSGRGLQLELAQFVNVTTNALGVVSGCSIIHQTITSQQLMKLLGDDTITLFIGAAAIIWVSVQQMVKP